LAGLDLLLVHIAREERLKNGQWLFARGEQLRASGHHAQALEMFRAAYNNNPANPDYHIAFIRALRASGRERETRTALEQLLARSPADGPANLELARLLAGNKQWQEAAWYYRRGLYGQWRDTPDLTALRFELAELLAAKKASRELLSELLLLDTAPVRERESRRLARLFLSAESWSRAEQIYRSLLQSEPADAGLWQGLAQAQFGNASYVGAQRSFERAAALNPANAGIREQLELTRQVTGLDPTQRRLTPAEKHRRAHAVALALLSAVEACDPELAIVSGTRAALEKHGRARNQLASAESDLDAIDQLWQSVEGVCTSPMNMPEPVRLIVAQLRKPAA
jgi:tetratricopeptide (TPR) repeat protein